MTYSFRTRRISISNDYVSWDLNPPLCAFLDTESKVIKEFPIPDNYWQLNEMLVFWRDFESRILEIVDPQNRWVVNVCDGLDEEEKKEKKYFDFKIGSNLLVTYCQFVDTGHIFRERMRMWKMGNPPVLLHDRTCKFRNLRLVKVDERFIVLRSIKTFYVISTETFEDIQTLRHDYNWDYNRLL